MNRTIRRLRAASFRVEFLETRELLSADLVDADLVDRSLIVKLAPNASVKSLMDRTGFAMDALGESGFTRITLPDGMDRDAVLAQWRSRPEFLSVELNHPISLAIAPNDPRYGEEWGLSQANDVDINAPQAWDVTTGNHQTLVSVTDTGIDYRHPDLYLAVWLNPGEIPASKAGIQDTNADGQIDFYDLNSLNALGGVVLNGSSQPVNGGFAADNNGNGYIDAGDLLTDTSWEDGVDQEGNGYTDDLIGWDTFYGDNDPFDLHGHGTHVSGTILARTDNATGVAGVNWFARVIPVQIFSNSGTGDVAQGIAAVDYASRAGARVINASWGDLDSAPWVALTEVIEDAGERGLGSVFVAAAGNSAYNNDYSLLTFYPASLPGDNILTVAAIDASGNLASFSDYGPVSVDLAAPGVSVLSTTRNGNYGLLSGTSMAAPHVAGIVSLLIDVAPTLNASQLVEWVRASTKPLASLAGKVLTGGLVDAQKVVSALAANREIRVFANGAELTSGTGGANLGQTVVGRDLIQTFTILNAGSSNLVLEANLGLPAGYVLDSAPATTTLGPRASTTFRVRLDASKIGTFQGNLTLPSNDSDEVPFQIPLAATVVAGSLGLLGAERPIGPAGVGNTANLDGDAAGNTVAVWLDEGVGKVYAQRFDKFGSKPGGPAEVFSLPAGWTGGSIGAPQIAVTPAGGSLVVWTYRPIGAANTTIVGQRFTAAGGLDGSQFQVSSPWDVSGVRLSAAADGRFVLLGTKTAGNGAFLGLFARTFNSSGSPTAAEVRVDDLTFSHGVDQTLLVRDNGEFLVAWRGDRPNVGGYGIFIRRFDALGAALMDLSKINATAVSFFGGAAVALRPNGEYLVAWGGNNKVSESDIHARRISATGAVAASEFKVNTTTRDAQHYPWIGVDGAGNVLVTWASDEQDGSGSGVYAQRYTPALVKTGPEFRVSRTIPGHQYYPVGSTATDGQTTLLWASTIDGHAFDAFAQVLGPEATFVNRVLSEQPAGYWRFAESSGTTAVDLSGYQRDGTYQNGVTLGQPGALSDEPANPSAGFDGSNDRVSVADAEALRSSQFTIMAWAYPDSGATTHDALVTKTSNSTWADGYGLYYSGGNIVFFVNSWTGVKVEAPIALNAWTHVTATYDGSALKLYLNGELAGTLAYAGPVQQSTSPLLIGAAPGGYAWSGRIDEVAIYPKALTAERIAEIPTPPPPSEESPPYSDVVLEDTPNLYWRLGEGSGTGAVDASGNGRTGTYAGNPALGQPGALTGDGDTAVGFDGVDDKVTASDHASLRPTQLTVEAWLRPETGIGNYAAAVLKATAPATWADGYGLYYSNGKIQFFVNHYTYGKVLFDIPLNAWTHVAATYDGQAIKLYLNGELKASKAYSVPIAHSTNVLVVGQGGTAGGPKSWKGKLDEVAIYGSALSQAQIQAHYQAGLG